MSLLSRLRARLRALFNRRADAELGDEIGFHIQLETEKNVALGMSPAEARRVAVAHFGGVQRVREEHRDVRSLQWLEDARGDTRFALRSLRRIPGLALTSIITLALGIGANVSIFSAVNAVVLRPLPFPASDRLMRITEENPEKHWVHNIVAPANFLDWRAGVSDFADAAAYTNFGGQSTLTGVGEPKLLGNSRVTGTFFNTLGVRPATRSNVHRGRDVEQRLSCRRHQRSRLAGALRRGSSDHRQVDHAQRKHSAGRRCASCIVRVPATRNRSVATSRVQSPESRGGRLPSRALVQCHRAPQAWRHARACRRTTTVGGRATQARLPGDQ